MTLSEPGWKTSICCPKPCRDPTPVYHNGQCLSIAHRDDPCQSDLQAKKKEFLIIFLNFYSVKGELLWLVFLDNANAKLVFNR